MQTELMLRAFAVLIVSSLPAFFGLAGSAHAVIYKCKDANGATTYVDSPCATGQTTMSERATNDPSTLGRGAAQKADNDAPRRKDRSTTASAPKNSQSTSSEAPSSGCEKMRKDFARQQSQSCIQGLQVATGKVMCMPEDARREYLARKKSALDAVCD